MQPRKLTKFDLVLGWVRAAFLLIVVTLLILGVKINRAEVPKMMTAPEFINFAESNEIMSTSGNPLFSGTDATTGQPCVTGYYTIIPAGGYHGRGAPPQYPFSVAPDRDGIVMREIRKQGFTLISKSDKNPHDRAGRWFIVLCMYAIIGLVAWYGSYLARKSPKPGEAEDRS